MSSTIADKGLLFTLDGASGVPFYRQIIHQIERAILAGKLVAGERLPTIRSLAIELKINPNTIAKAYAELELKQFVVTQVGSGTYVASRKPSINEEEKEIKIALVIDRCVRELEALGIGRSEIPDLFMEFREENSI